MLYMMSNIKIDAFENCKRISRDR